MPRVLTPLAKTAGSPTNFPNLLAKATTHEIENEEKIVGVRVPEQKLAKKAK